jgi:uncharacterized protein (DUF433 family)
MTSNDNRRSDFEDRIVADPDVLAGKPVIKGTRISVSMILGLVAHGVTFDEIIEDYPELTADDIRAAILYADAQLPG